MCLHADVPNLIPNIRSLVKLCTVTYTVCTHQTKQKWALQLYLQAHKLANIEWHKTGNFMVKVDNFKNAFTVSTS